MIDPHLRTPHRAGRTVLDVAAGLCLLTLLAVLLLPAALRASGGAEAASQCLSKVEGLGQALLGYATSHQNRMPGDDRYVDAGSDKNADILRAIPDNQQQYNQSWLAKLNAYAPVSPADLDCPLVNDHRKGAWWPTDYVISRWAINTSTAVATDPARAVLVAEPNMPRSTVLFLAESIGWEDGARPDLEQNIAQSLSFGFVDGHAARVAIAANNAHLASYPQIFMAQPGAEPYDQNFLWWAADQTLPAGF